MNPAVIVEAITRIILALFQDRMTPQQTARALLDTALATGVPENELSSYLTAAARERQELAFEAAKRAKFG